MIRLQNVLKMSSRHICENFWKCFEDVLKTYQQDVLKMSWRNLEDILKTPWKRFQDASKTFLQKVLKTSWKRLEDVLKTYGQDEYIGLEQDALKTSSEDVWLIRILLKTKTKDVSRRLQDVFIKTNVCWQVVLLLMTTPLIYLELQLVVIPFL